MRLWRGVPGDVHSPGRWLWDGDVSHTVFVVSSPGRGFAPPQPHQRPRLPVRGVLPRQSASEIPVDQTSVLESDLVFCVCACERERDLMDSVSII